MFDQLRFDYLSCAGHPHLHTPNFDRVAARGVRFTSAYVQSPICGAGRMCFYTGRYASSHGAQWNGFPLRVGEMTVGDHLRAVGMQCWLVGKTHMKPDAEGMKRLGIEHDSVIGARQSECGFDVWVRDDGLWAFGPDGFYDERRSPYNEYLKSRGYGGENPWADHANAGLDGDSVAPGFFMQNADMPANVREEDSETAWLTREAIKFLDQASGPWCCHVSYIKPHWPYIVPAPYHDMFGENHVPAASRHSSELESPHPVYEAFMSNAVGQAFRRDEVRKKVIPAYMGLIKQCDDHLGHLLDHLERSGLAESTMVVLTSDHGDYLGDHWLGEKALFHDESVRIPLIIMDPSPEADGTRGTVCDELVEAIDLAPTFVERAGGEPPSHILEGRSLMPFIRGEKPGEWRDYAISEYDYSVTPMRGKLGLSSRDARLFMVADRRWKFMHAEGGFRPMLFDRREDPREFFDLGESPDHQDTVAMMYEKLGQWGRRMSQRVTRSESDIEQMRGRSIRRGVTLGLYDGSEIDPELVERYRGPGSPPPP